MARAFNPAAPAFVPASRASAARDAAREARESGADAPARARASGGSDASGGGAAGGASDATLREALEVKSAALERAEEQLERLKAAAAQAGRMAKAYSNVDEDVKRLERVVREREEECERALDVTRMLEGDLERTREREAAATRERDALKEELKATLKKTLAAATELKETKAARDEAVKEAVDKARQELAAEMASAATEREASTAAAVSSAVAAAEAALRAAFASERAELEKTCESLRAALAEANARALAAADECENLKTQLDASAPAPNQQEEMDELRRLLREEEENSASVTSSLQQTRAELESVKATLNARTEELRRVQESENALGVALSNAEAQIVESRKNVDLVVSRAEAASKIFSENAAALRLSDARAATAELQVSVAEEKAKSLEESLDAALAESDVLSREIEELRAQLVTARASPAKSRAPSDVIEALEHERRARALYQSDARYWRERFEASTLGAAASALTPRAITPGNALAIAAGLPRTPTTADIRAVPLETEPEPAREPAPESPAVDSDVENRPPIELIDVRTKKTSRKLAEYFT